MSFDFDSSTIFIGVSGSFAYGTATSQSDVDLRGVCIPPREIRDSFYRSFDHYVSPRHQGNWGDLSQKALGRLLEYHPAGENYRRSDPFARANGVVDLCIYSIVKFVHLCANNNPNVLELLFLEESDWLFFTGKWSLLCAQRDLFLSQRCKDTYLGYAASQLKRIKSHRKWLLNPPIKKPTREDFGLPENPELSLEFRNRINGEILNTIKEWGVEDFLEESTTRELIKERMLNFQEAVLLQSARNSDNQLYEIAASSIGIPEHILENLKKEKSYKNSLNEWKQFQKWKTERNPERAQLESEYGYDCKHASHLIRLIKTGIEILRDGKLTVRRPQEDIEELKAIRSGAYSYDALIEYYAQLHEEIIEASHHTKLPRKPPFEKIDNLLFSILEGT